MVLSRVLGGSRALGRKLLVVPNRHNEFAVTHPDEVPTPSHDIMYRP